MAKIFYFRVHDKTKKDKLERKNSILIRFSVYQEKVIDLIKSVITVSVETVRIVKEMEKND